jgi:hypothetical protein
MKKLILFFVFAAIVLQFTSCKVEDDPTNDNPDVTSVVIDTTLKSFYVKPTPSSTFESIYAFDFSTSPLFINSILFINLNWNDAVEEHGIYLNFTTTTGDALIDGNGFLKAFDSGVKIDSTLAGTWSGYDDGVFSYDYIANPSANKGNLAGQGDKYIVFRAYDGGSPQNKYYGWLRVNVAANGRDIKVLSIGFQKNANMSLRTGEL